MILYTFLVLSSVFFIIKKVKQNDPFFRIDWNALSKFLAFLAVMTLLRVCMLDFAVLFFPTKVISLLSAASAIPFAPLSLVFWEDIWFTVPIAYMMKNLYNKGPLSTRFAQIAIIAISVCFGLGHIYQGWFAVIATSFYPYFISYEFGKKYGLGTVMLGHMLYDFITIATFKTLLLYFF